MENYMLGIRNSMDRIRKRTKHNKHIDLTTYELNDRIIERCSEHIEETITGSTWYYFAKNSFF